MPNFKQLNSSLGLLLSKWSSVFCGMDQRHITKYNSCTKESERSNSITLNQLCLCFNDMVKSFILL